MCQQLVKLNIAFERSDNKIVWLSDFAAAAKLAEQFNHIDWPSVLIRQVVRGNSLVDDIVKVGFGGYRLGAFVIRVYCEMRAARC